MSGLHALAAIAVLCLILDRFGRRTLSAVIGAFGFGVLVLLVLYRLFV